MSEKISFELFQDSDAQKVAELLTRNRFYIGEYKNVTADDYLYVQNNRGMSFSILAKKQDEVIGMVAAYPTSGQKVADSNQIFMGTLLIDLRYRLSYAVLVGLYDGIIAESLKNGCGEILAEVSPKNKQSLYILLKYGFVLLDDRTNVYGYLTLHNYFPSILRFLGIDSIESCTSKFFNNLPVIDKRNAYVGKSLLADKFIESNYLTGGKKIVLLIDTINYKIDGIDFIDYLKIYPDFSANNRYCFENKQKDGIINLEVEKTIELDATESIEKDNISIEAGKTHWLELSENVEAFRISVSDEYYTFSPRKILPQSVDLNTFVSFGWFSLQIEHTSGFVSLINSNSETLIKFMWPCVSPPYLEGALIPRKKNLLIENKTDVFNIVENCDHYELKRSFVVKDDKLSIITTLKCNDEQINIAPLSNIWIESKLKSCMLASDDDQLSLAPILLDPEKSHFDDCAFWNPDIGAEASFPVKNINLNFVSDVIDIIIDEKCKPVIHIPTLTFFLNFDSEKIKEEQIIEQLEIYYNMEDL